MKELEKQFKKLNKHLKDLSRLPRNWNSYNILEREWKTGENKYLDIKVVFESVKVSFKDGRPCFAHNERTVKVENIPLYGSPELKIGFKSHPINTESSGIEGLERLIKSLENEVSYKKRKELTE